MLRSLIKLTVHVRVLYSVERNELKFFDDCRKMNLSVTVSDPSIFQVLGTSGNINNTL